MVQGGKKLGQQMKAKATPKRGPIKIRKGGLLLCGLIVGAGVGEAQAQRNTN